jgi:polyisoprenoid-binding protein YceI
MRFTRLLLAPLALCMASPAFAADNYELDKSHTRILFYVNHLGFSDTIGDMTKYDGSFTFDEKDPSKSSVTLSLDPTGIRTSSEALDKHLQNADFFNTEKFPKITFTSTAVKVTGENTGEVTGDMTLLGVTKPVTLKVTFNKGDYHPYTKSYVAGFSGSTSFKRSDFGMAYGIPNVSDEVKLEFELEGINLDRKKAEEIAK